MIVDRISNWHRFLKNSIFLEIFKELEKYSIETPNGIYRHSKHYYFKVMNYDTKFEPIIIESHRKEVDIHIVLNGSERINIYPNERVVISKSYSSKSDCQFYHSTGSPIYEIELLPGYMAIFFPNDIHMPQLVNGEQCMALKKIVIKINEKLFSL